jgi:excisionase family DNA binding protein
VTEPSGLPLLLTVDEAAALLRTTRSGIYAMAERAQVPGIVRIGRRLLFRRDELLEWLGVGPKEKTR